MKVKNLQDRIPTTYKHLYASHGPLLHSLKFVYVLEALNEGGEPVQLTPTPPSLGLPIPIVVLELKSTCSNTIVNGGLRRGLDIPIFH